MSSFIPINEVQTATESQLQPQTNTEPTHNKSNNENPPEISKNKMSKPDKFSLAYRITFFVVFAVCSSSFLIVIFYIAANDGPEDWYFRLLGITLGVIAGLLLLLLVGFVLGRVFQRFKAAPWLIYPSLIVAIFPIFIITLIFFSGTAGLAVLYLIAAQLFFHTGWTLCLLLWHDRPKWRNNPKNWSSTILFFIASLPPFAISIAYVIIDDLDGYSTLSAGEKAIIGISTTFVFVNLVLPITYISRGAIQSISWFLPGSVLALSSNAFLIGGQFVPQDRIMHWTMMLGTFFGLAAFGYQTVFLFRCPRKQTDPTLSAQKLQKTQETPPIGPTPIKEEISPV